MEQVAARTQLRSEMRQRDGMAFQSLFADIMVRRYRDDFSRVAPWGRDGDRNNGYSSVNRSLHHPAHLAKGQALRVQTLRNEARGLEVRDCIGVLALGDFVALALQSFAASSE